MRATATFGSIVVLTTLLLAGCAVVAPIQQDQTIVLGQDQGLAVVAFNVGDPMSQVYFEPTDSKGTKLAIDSVPKGYSMYLFVATAGQYCLEKFNVAIIKARTTGRNGPCFEVEPGKLGYSGVITPIALFGGVMMHADYEDPTYRALLKSKYPKIAAQFLPKD